MCDVRGNSCVDVKGKCGENELPAWYEWVKLSSQVFHKNIYTDLYMVSFVHGIVI